MEPQMDYHPPHHRLKHAAAQALYDRSALPQHERALFHVVVHTTFALIACALISLVLLLPDAAFADQPSDASTITICKVSDQSANLLSNAHMSLAGDFIEGEEQVDFLTRTTLPNSSRNGFFESDILKLGGIYLLTETLAPTGYIISPFSNTFPDCNLRNGALVLQLDDSGSLMYETTSGSWAQIQKNTVYVKDAPTRLSIDVVDETGLSVSGAVFSITPADGSYFADSSTEALSYIADGLSAIEGKLVCESVVRQDIYQIEQTQTAEGYDVAKPFTIAVQNDGTIRLIDESATGYVEIGQQGSVTVLNKAIPVVDETPESSDTTQPQTPDAEVDTATSGDNAAAADKPASHPENAGQNAKVAATISPRAGDFLPTVVAIILVSAVSVLLLARHSIARDTHNGCKR